MSCKIELHGIVAVMVLALGLSCSGSGGSSLLNDLGKEELSPEISAGDTKEERRGLEDTVATDTHHDALPEEETAAHCLPGEGCFLDKCLENADCQSGWCVEHMGEGVCTVPCQEECPAGWSCKQASSGGPDLVYLCVSKASNLCKPCSTTEGCKSVGGTQDVCVDYGEAGRFCGASCGDQDECPWGFSCIDATTAEGTVLKQCVADAAVCPCTQKSVALALTTPCFVNNEFGTCQGKRVCGQDGLTACDAPVPAAESCNGFDDDCDGLTDEPAEVGGDFVNLCNDDNDCTMDTCKGKDGCTYTILDEGECIDGDACTVGDHCEQGVCVGNKVLCDDNNPCTDDSCDGLGGCVFVANQADCDDLDPCTVADRCQDKICVGTPIDCDCKTNKDCQELEDGDLCNGILFCDTSKKPFLCKIAPESVVSCPQPEGVDAICQAASCDPLTGKCSLVPNHEGYACNDGNACTVGDSCLGGVCTPGVQAICKDDNPCTTDSCSPDKGCQFTQNTLPCNDGNACTTGDVCFEGVCAGSGTLQCDDGNVCTNDSCDKLSGCLYMFNTLPCDDYNSCTTGDVCKNGICAGTGTLQCDDSNPCTADICLPDGGCKHESISVPCSDGNPCTIGDTCVNGSCAPGKPADCNDSNPCTDDSCNKDGICVYTPNSLACDDGNACTTGDKCNFGLCGYSSLLNCNDDNICTTDSCDPKTGCVFKMNTAPCDDGDVCTTNDKCNLGQCVGGAVLVCNDNNPCTDDTCQLGKGCVFTPNSAPCDDGNLCSTGDNCSQGKCTATGTLDCDDNNPCTKDGCAPSSGCTYTFQDGPCDDANACTANDQCSAGKCVGSVPVNCSDDNPCTSDSCDPILGCVHVPLSQGGCDDKNPCTIDDKCSNGVCVAGGALNCNDDNTCTDDSCDPLSGCVFAANQAPCDDKDPCTVGDKCADKSCKAGSQTLNCADEDPCTDDSCQPELGCVHAPSADGTPCGVDMKCQQGQCIPSVLKSCKEVKQYFPNSPSGVYKIDPDGSGPVTAFDAWCELSLDSGGWTLVMNINTADGHMSKLLDNIWTTTSEYNAFSQRWAKDYKSLAAVHVQGTDLLVIVRSHNASEGANPVGWRSWKLISKKAFHDFFTVSMGAYNANATGGCNNGHSGDGRKQTNGILSAGVAATYDTFTGFANDVYSNSYYGNCETTGDGFRLSSWYRWANNSNVGLGLQMDGSGDTTYTLEAGSHMKFDTYGNPQRYCGSCSSCSAYADGSCSSGNTKAAIGTDHYYYHCTIGVSYRYEWYVR